jgi:sterol desaturase/sphingolipid hydroxylase (fatty acid hydroxylase superfamily)
MSDWLGAFLIGVVVGSFVEYWGHRAMHTFLLKKKHVLHHKEGGAQGWFWEFLDYVLGAGFILPIGFLHSIEAGISFAGGALTYAAFAAYSHQLQHERPELCFWLVRPVHKIHHGEQMWRHNFGIGVDIWDRVFGTYKKVVWVRPKPWRECSLWQLLQIKWV